jgi:hypothetical protein
MHYGLDFKVYSTKRPTCHSAKYLSASPHSLVLVTACGRVVQRSLSLYQAAVLQAVVSCCVQIAVCTPGRMIDLIKMKACTMLRATYLVFDEADRMFDMGFEPQVSSNSHAFAPHLMHDTRMPSLAPDQLQLHRNRAFLASICVGLVHSMMTATTPGGLLEQTSWVADAAHGSTCAACAGAQHHGPGAARQADTAVHCNHAYQG